MINSDDRFHHDPNMQHFLPFSGDNNHHSCWIQPMFRGLNVSTFRIDPRCFISNIINQEKKGWSIGLLTTVAHTLTEFDPVIVNVDVNLESQTHMQTKMDRCRRLSYLVHVYWEYF